MLEIAKMSLKNRSDLITYTAVELGINEAIVEKDFWVCFMLDVLFHDFKYSEYLAFKGGTSLSKGYNIIERFSEDIDIILDWRLLGYSEEEPWNERSNTSQIKFSNEISIKTRNFLNLNFMPELAKKLDDIAVVNYKLYMKENENEVIYFEYPRKFKDNALVKEIRLEIGCLAAWTPLTIRRITPMIAKNNNKKIKVESTNIRTVDAKRTFWEKATILHDVAHRTTIPSRYSRHYYDLYMMSKSNIKILAFKDVELLGKVAEFKDKFYHSNRARYDLANIKNIELIPSEDVKLQLQKDYNSMKSMIYGKTVSFDSIIEELEILLAEIRKLDN